MQKSIILLVATGSLLLFGCSVATAGEIERLLTLGYKMPQGVVVKSDRKRAGYDLTHNIIYLPTREYSPEVWAELQEKNKRNGYYYSSALTPKDGYVASQTRHEVAHAIEYQNNLFKDGEWFAILQQIDPKRDISEYASTNPREAFAEAFAMYTSPLYGAEIKRMPKVVEDFIEAIKTK